MFTKRPDTDAAKLASMAPIQRQGPSATVVTSPAARPTGIVGAKSIYSSIAPDLTITGNLVSKGEVQVDGEVQGDIHCVHLVVGQHGRITGSIVADDVVMRGHVMGSIRGNRVNLQASSRVEGDIFHQSLSIEQGAMFEGRSRRANPDEQISAARIEGTKGVSPPATN